MTNPRTDTNVARPAMTLAKARSAHLERDLLGLGLGTFGQGDGQDSVLERGLDVVGLDRRGQRDDPLAAAVGPAVVEVTTALLRLEFAPDEEHAVVDGDLYILVRH